MSTLHDFKQSLATGEHGQREFVKLWPGLVPTDGRRGDFRAPDGRLIELKSDSYKHNETENFFIERFSCIKQQSPGGPWQAATHGCDTYAYYFVNSGIAYLFSVPELLVALEPLVPTWLIHVRNKGWTTGGFKLQRAKIAHLATVLSTK